MQKTTTTFIDLSRLRESFYCVTQTDYTAEDMHRIDKQVVHKYPIGKEWTRYDWHLAPDGKWDQYRVIFRVEGYRCVETDNLTSDYPVVREISRVLL